MDGPQVILLDTCVWIDHIRAADADVLALLGRNKVLCHPFVIGEVALGQIRDRKDFLADMRDLPAAEVASHDEAMVFIERYSLFGSGLSFVDAHLLAAVLLTSGAKLWTRDKRLHAAAEKLGLAADIR